MFTLGAALTLGTLDSLDSLITLGTLDSRITLGTLFTRDALWPPDISCYLPTCHDSSY